MKIGKNEIRLHINIPCTHLENTKHKINTCIYLSKNFRIVKVHFLDINMSKNKIRILHTWYMVVINIPFSHILAKSQNRHLSKTFQTVKVHVIDMKIGQNEIRRLDLLKRNSSHKHSTTFTHTYIIPNRQFIDMNMGHKIKNTFPHKYFFYSQIHVIHFQ